MEFKPSPNNELLYSPYTRIALGIEDIVDALQMAFLEFNEDNDTTDKAYKLAQALYAKCFFNLAPEGKEGKSREDYKRLISDFKQECKMYERGEMDYERFESRFSDYYNELLFMKSLAGFRIKRRDNKDRTADMKADVQDDLIALEKDDDYEEEEGVKA